MKKIIEAVAKLQRMEKTMILDQFTSRAAAGSPAPEHILGGVGLGGRDGRMIQKGVFNMRWSFATASILFITVLWSIFVLEINNLSADGISQYQIRSIDDNLITLSNDAILAGHMKDFVALQKWRADDLVEIILTNRSIILPHPVKLRDGSVTFYPIFRLLNLTKGNEIIDVVLQHPPTPFSPGTFSVVAVDLDHRTVTLNDGTTWVYPERDQFDVKFWQVGDTVIMGAHAIFPPSPFNIILLNATRQRLIRAAQQ